MEIIFYKKRRLFNFESKLSKKYKKFPYTMFDSLCEYSKKDKNTYSLIDCDDNCRIGDILILKYFSGVDEDYLSDIRNIRKLCPKYTLSPSTRIVIKNFNSRNIRGARWK